MVGAAVHRPSECVRASVAAGLTSACQGIPTGAPRLAIFPNRASAELSAFVGCTGGDWQTVSAAVITPPQGYVGNSNINAISNIVDIGAC